MSFLDDLKNVDINNIGAWPLPLKIAGIGIICLLLLGGGWYFIIQGELDEHSVAKQKEEELRGIFLAKKEQAINLPAYRQQMEEIHQTFGSLLRQLPNSTEVPELLVDITQAGLGRGLEFVLFKPERESAKQFYAELPISIQVNGSYHELALFISDVSALPRIVTFGNITITPATGNRLNMSAQAYTYRYIDDRGAPAPAAKPARKQGGL